MQFLAKIKLEKFIAKNYVNLINAIIKMIDGGYHIEEIRAELVKMKDDYIDKFNLYEKE